MTEKHSPIYVSAHVVTNLHPNPDPGCLLTYESVDLNSLSSEVADMHQVDQIVAELNTAASLKTRGLNSMIDHLPSLPLFHLCLWWSRLPNTMAQNLSVPLAFVALLHLANEKVSFALETRPV